ncbi:MAG TPA: YeeE/YedE thiosulfate transporter family protein [Gemmatimonadales bacterium]|jgi:hypothetical protein
MAPLADFGFVGASTGLLIALGLGVAFGFFLERGGLGNAVKLAGQFYLTDLTVFKVMFAAIVTAMLGLFWLAVAGVVQLPLVFVPSTFVLPHIAGGVVFGVGFVVGGLCPGTSCVSASSGRLDGLAVMGGVMLGILVFNEAFPLIEAFYRATPLGPVTVPQVLGLPHGVMVAATVAAALLGFAAAERLERRARPGRE